MGAEDPPLSDGIDAEQEPSANANVSDSEGYEDVTSVVDRTKKRIRERKAKMQAEVQKAYEEDQQRKKAREAAHQARLERLDKYRQVQQRIARSRTRKQRDQESAPEDEESEQMVPMPPSKHARRGGPVAKESPLKLRLKKKAEARRKDLELWMQNHEKELAKKDAESKIKADEAAALARMRIEERRRQEAEQHEAQEAEESEREEEIRRREEEARRIGTRRAKDRVLSDAARRKQEERLRAERLEEQQRRKAEREAAEAALLPQVRASAGERARQRYLQEKAIKERSKMEKVAQQKAKQEKMKQYKNPRAIAQVKLREEAARDQALLADEVAQFIVGDAVTQVSTTDPDSTEEFQAQLEEEYDEQYSGFLGDCEGVPSSLPPQRHGPASTSVTEAPIVQLV